MEVEEKVKKREQEKRWKNWEDGGQSKDVKESMQRNIIKGIAIHRMSCDKY